MVKNNFLLSSSMDKTGKSRRLSVYKSENAAKQDQSSTLASQPRRVSVLLQA